MGIPNLSNFPNSFPHGVSLRGYPIVDAHAGHTFWSSSTYGSNGGDGNIQNPFGTLAYAVSQATAANDDRVFLRPGHAETISSSSALTLSKAGMRITGVGVGSARPTFTLDTATTATINVTAADITIENCIFSANFADIVSLFTLTTAKNFRLVNCYIKATATDMNFLSVIDTNATTADADGLTLIGNEWIEPDLATLYMVKMDGTNARFTALGNKMVLGVNNNVAGLCAIATGKILTAADIGWNRLYRLNTDSATGALLVTTDGSTNTGMIYNNYIQHADTAAELIVTASSGFGLFDNKCSGVAGASGYLLPAADS